MKYMNSLKDGAISDDDLDMVAGGSCSSGITACGTLC